MVIGIGTRYSDFTTASRTAFQNPDVRFVNINVAGMDVIKHAGLGVQADAREALEALLPLLDGYSVDESYGRSIAELDATWDETVRRAYAGPGRNPGPNLTGRGAGSLGHDIEPRRGLLTQNEVIGMVNELSDPRDVVVCAAGSMPGDLHKLWRTRDPKGYHVEYGYSCMGYEVAGGLGVAGLPRPGRVRHGRRRLVPDDGHRAGDRGAGGHQDHHGAGPEPRLRLDRLAVGVAGFTTIRHQVSLPEPRDRRLDGEKPIDLAANAASFGLEVFRTSTPAEFADAIKAAKAATSRW